MDNLKTLFDKKEFELIIKLTNTSTDCDQIFYRLSAFMSLNKIQEALDCLQENHAILERERLPWCMRLHIELLCFLKRFDDAYEKVHYYENLPYYSQEAEEVIKELPSTVRELEKAARISSRFNDEDEVFKALQSKDSTEVLAAIDSLKNKDITPYILPITKVLTSFPKQTVRSLVLCTLVAKRYPHVIEFNQDGNIIKVIPVNLKMPFTDDEFIEFTNSLSMRIKNPSFVNTLISIISNYSIYTFPSKFENCDEMLEAAIQITKSYLHIEDDSVKLDYDYPLDKEKIDYYTIDIKKSIEDL